MKKYHKTYNPSRLGFNFAAVGMLAPTMIGIVGYLITKKDLTSAIPILSVTWIMALMFFTWPYFIRIEVHEDGFFFMNLLRQKYIYYKDVSKFNRSNAMNGRRKPIFMFEVVFQNGKTFPINSFYWDPAILREIEQLNVEWHKNNKSIADS